MRIRIVLIVLLVPVLLLTLSYAQKDTDWKGTIEKENGLEIIKNPAEPLYGEITLDLEKDLEIGNEEDEKYLFYKWARIEVDKNENIYVLDAGTGLIKKYDRRGNHILSIGAQGQGPGEFFDPHEVVLDGKGLLYVRDSWEIEVFDQDGKFLNNFKPNSRISNFYVFESGNILAESFTGESSDVVLLNSDWQELKTIASYSIDLYRYGVRTPYTPYLWVCSLSNRLFLYGFPTDYRLNLVDSQGKIIRVIEKEIKSKDLRLTNTEKSKFIDFKMKRSEARRPERKIDRSLQEKYINFPKDKALFYRVYSDSENRIYVRQIVEPLIEETHSLFDLFDENGIYLYRITLPFSIGMELLGVIHMGNLYREEENLETGYIKIVRYKIKNWDQIKTGISN